MTTNIGQILTRADIPGLVETARTVSGVGTAVSGGGGGLGDLEGVLRLIERFVPLFEQAGTMLIKLQNQDAAVAETELVSRSDPQMGMPPPPPRPEVIAAPKISRSQWTCWPVPSPSTVRVGS